ncbi:MAG: tRNA 2-selenouridine(34) synthase MnmH [Oscillospiraceae bacterium]|nr:tRNA 2-selenouridine(34) synthase MnmH [Oscillospiraceae bacterium]
MFKEKICEDLSDSDILIDVRSPKEYNEAHITGAINLPILTDEEREEVGTIYTKNTEEAKLLAVKYGSNKIFDLFKSFVSLYEKDKNIILYCARGGMRSSCLASMIDSLGYRVFKLKGGFKAYRNFIIASIPKVNENIKYVMLHGKTGVGKTILLKRLKESGFDTLDFEEAANHRGSALGSIGLGKCNSQKYFESYIYESLKNRMSNLVFVEAESKRVGNSFIPDSVENSMEEGFHILIELPMMERIKILKEEYLNFENVDEEIKESIIKSSKNLGIKLTTRLLDLLSTKNYDEFIELINIKYYDPLYEKSIKKYDYDLKIYSIDNAIDQIINFIRHQYQ